MKLKRLFIPLSLAVACLAWTFIHVRGQVTNLPIIGNESATLSGIGSPTAGYGCVAQMANLLYVDESIVVTGGRFWSCNNVSGSYTWMNLPNAVTYYLNGVAQAGARCDFVTGTTSGAGTITFNIAGMGYTTIIGQAQPSMLTSGTNPGTVNVTATSTTAISLYATTGTAISIVGINIISFAAAAVPVGVFVCGI